MYKIVLWVIEVKIGGEMQLNVKETTRPKNLRDSAMSIPSSIYTTKVLGKDINITSGCCAETIQENVIAEMWGKQHPLIHTWLLLSSISICFLSALFFIIP